MRLIRFTTAAAPDRPVTGADCGDGFALPLAGGALGPFEPIGEPLPIGRLLAPIEPAVIMGIGLNYRAHAAEQGKEPPERPMMFMKNPAAVCGPLDDIRVPRVCQDREQVDFECELAVVIGRLCRDVPVERALGHVLGCTAANDVSARWWQKHGGGGQFCRGKSFDTFCPIGPCIVTPDELGDAGDLRLMTRVNGETMQESSTSDLIFSIAELIAYLSEGTTLRPGTLILTGTPGGVGFARTPPVWLHDGDVVEVEVEKIGVLRNRVVYER